jgi:solute carrier family 6 amino acid transporter-like protein 5/7/9/14
MIVTTLDTFTSLIAGFTIFGILGNLAYNVNENDISNVVKSGGSGLAFVSYPEAISKFESLPQLFAALFFFMLFTLGIGSAVGVSSSLIRNLRDLFIETKQWKIAAVACVLSFCVGIIYTTQAGQWLLTLGNI